MTKNNTASFAKKFKYHISLTFCRARSKIFQLFSNKYPWMSLVDEDMVLSSLPLKGHKQALLDLQKSTGKEVRILSMIERFEQSPSFINKPLDDQFYIEMGIKRQIVETPDFKPLSIETFQKAIDFLAQNSRDKAITLIHCKAGVGRSASVVLTWQVIKDAKANKVNLKSDNLHDLVKSYVKKLKKIRHHVNIRGSQQHSIARFLRAYQAKV